MKVEPGEEPTALVFVQSMSSDETHWVLRWRWDFWECSCNGFRARGACPHIAIARDAARGSKFDGVRVDFVSVAGSAR